MRGPGAPLYIGSDLGKLLLEGVEGYDDPKGVRASTEALRALKQWVVQNPGDP